MVRQGDDEFAGWRHPPHKPKGYKIKKKTQEEIRAAFSTGNPRFEGCCILPGWFYYP